MPTVSRRALGRASLARQMLLRRHELSSLDAVERLAGLQAQVPLAPYVGLWSRLAGFTTGDLATLMLQRRVVRGSLMRGTLHLASAADALGWRPLFQGLFERVFGGTAWGQGLRGKDVDAITEAGRVLFHEAPRTRAQVAALLAERWPDEDPEALGQAATYRVPLVQVTPRGVWGQSQRATWTTYEAWLGRDPVAGRVGDLLLRYFAAFGPASVMDAQAWCGLTRLSEVVEGLDLIRLQGDDGRELFDLPDAPRPDPDVPAPVRFLPEYDNLLLAYADRTRFLTKIPKTFPPWGGNGPRAGTFLVDGECAGLWDIQVDGDTARLVVAPLDPLPGPARDEVEAEGTALLRFATDAAAHVVEVR